MKRVISHTLGLIFVLMLVRAHIMGLDQKLFDSNAWDLLKLLYYSFQDITFALLLGLFALLMLFFSGKHPRIASFVYFFYLGCACLGILTAVINVEALKILNTPINYQLWYYADIMESDFMSGSIASATYWSVIGISLILMLVVVGLGWVLPLLSRRLLPKPYAKTLLAGLFLIFYAFFSVKSLAFTNRVKENFEDDYRRAESPVFAFVHSYYSHWFTEYPHLEFEETLEEDVEPNAAKTDVSEEKAPLISHPAIKHVVVVVLESVQAGYVAGYDTLYAVTPNIQQHLRDALVVSNAYAHTPNSTNSLFSLHTSLYPLLSFRTLIKEQPDFDAPTISAVLKDNNYRTAFFTSTDYTYCRVNEYLANQQYDTMADHKSLNCHQGSINSEAEGVGVVKPESCLVDQHIAWMEQQGGAPTFSMLWTVQTHWSYFVFGEEEEYAMAGGNTDLNKYLNALRETDQAVGKLFSYLHRTGKYDSTLVVLVGDHGEAFGKHNQYGHGSNIYEENVRVPLIFVNPLLFRKERTASITGHIDVAPTILDILGIAAPAEWQGTSVFDARRPNRTYFFSTWTDYLYGYREGDTKVIYNLYKDKALVFNLQDDPEEQQNLAAEMPATVATGKKQISRWVQQHRKFMEQKNQLSASAE